MVHPPLSSYASTPQSKSDTAKPKRRCASKGLAQAYQLRDFAHQVSAALAKQITSEDGTINLTRDEDGRLPDVQALVGIVKAWVEADDRVRIHRNKPLPGSLRPAPKERSKPKREAPAPGPVVYPAPSVGAGADVVSDKGEKQAEDGPKEGV